MGLWQHLLLAVVCCELLFSAKAIPENLLFPEDNVVSLPIGDDLSSPAIKLKVPIVYFGITHKILYINNNGIISFQSEMPKFFNIEFPLDNSVIAGMYSNVDTSNSGTVTYFETDNRQILHRATSSVHDAFVNQENFEATSVFVATWRQVGYHKGGSDKQNTFQIAIYTNGTETFIEFLYPENGIQWIQSDGDESGLPDARAQAGLISSDGRFHTLPGSGTDQVKNLIRWSNMDLPGQWLFRVGNVDFINSVQEPDSFTGDNLVQSEAKTCSDGANQCHSHAKCIDINEGFCCDCKRQYYGNGKTCIKRDIPLRVNGKVNGEINGIFLENLDLQSYVVMLDGRAYTAMSKIPLEIGFSIQSLQMLGATIGWLFAKPVNDAINGYQLTGGYFNHTLTVSFIGMDKKLNIKQKYLGLDVFDQLRIEVDVQGTIPTLPYNSKVNIQEYKEEYTLTAPGVVQSSSTRSLFYNNDNNEEVVLKFKLEQTFVFEFCEFADVADSVIWKLKVGKNFISYEAREQIIRFGLSGKMGPLGEIDPCEEGRATCGPNSSCVVDDDAYRCICNPGYQQIHRDGEPFCADVNECQMGVHDCDTNAQCLNELGTFRCDCNPGFTGTGQLCLPLTTCQDVHCPENAECVEMDVALVQCQCVTGFTGNGQHCVALASVSCNEVNNCSPFGYCSTQHGSGSFSCTCLKGYSGDGYNCYPEVPTQPPPVTEAAITESHQDTNSDYTLERCYDGICECLLGYSKVEGSSYCIRDSVTAEPPKVERETARPVSPQDANSCYVQNNCHAEAQCLRSSKNGTYQCFCNTGFDGDGYECRQLELSCATEDTCDEFATCEYQRQLDTYTCVCIGGYQGNGLKCEEIATCTADSHCPVNEICEYTDATKVYACECATGLVRNAQQICLRPVVENKCGGGVCVQDAECLYDDEYETHYCSCKHGFEGDGITHCEPKPVGCNVVNNCGLHANCEWNQTIAGYKCRCMDGFEGNGFLCYAEQNCHINPYMCDTHATCITTSQRKYVCECNRDYVGNGTTCIKTPKHEGNFLFLNQGMATLKIPFEVSRKIFGRPIQIRFRQAAVGLDIDCYAGRVYWSDIEGRAIRSSSYNGTNKEEFIVKDIGSPEGLAIDWVSRNIYWTDSTRDTIEVASIESKIRKTLFNTDLVNPRGIAVHPQRGKIFWTDWDRTHPKIEWANTDGTDRQIFLEGAAVQLPNSLAIDYFSEQLCYTDAGTKNIECVNIDNKIRQKIASNCTYPFGIAVTENHVYWSDWITKKIERVYKPTLKRVPPLDVPLGGSGNKLYGLVAVPDQCPNLTNVCQYYKDQCPYGYICLPDGKGSRRCVCGHKADSNEKPVCNDT